MYHELCQAFIFCARSACVNDMIMGNWNCVWC